MSGHRANNRSAAKLHVIKIVHVVQRFTSGQNLLQAVDDVKVAEHLVWREVET